MSPSPPPKKKQPQLVMRRPHLDNLPDLRLPGGYSLRAGTADDGIHWVAIINASFGGNRTLKDFATSMVASPFYRAERILFVCAPDGMPCATASAWRTASAGERTGYLHMVGTHPAHGGKQLGLGVSLAVLYRFREEGCVEAMLQTDDWRLGAIKTYLRLGFHPWMVDDRQPDRWTAVLRQLNWPVTF